MCNGLVISEYEVLKVLGLQKWDILGGHPMYVLDTGVPRLSRLDITGDIFVSFRWWSKESPSAVFGPISWPQIVRTSQVC